MEAMMTQFKDLQIIPFEEITKATNNFHKDNYLGGGGFGNVYKGELSRFNERGMVAFKRLDRQYGQGETEFLKEISTLSQYKHENLIALLGYCIKEREMILVYEYTAHGSLDFHLGSRDLTWTQRLKICLQAAEGLRYLHDPNEAHHKLIHRDIKSGNILLDEKWNAKVADVGLSKISPENTNLVTKVTGTPGYTDPEYHETYMLTEHSDVYSFGVTLFEVLCGSLCYEITGENNVRVFVRKWKESYQENKLEEIIFKELDIKLIDPSSIKLFSDIAYQCLNKTGKERPTMAEVVSKLKAALETQEDYNLILKYPEIEIEIEILQKYTEIARAAVSPVKYRSIEELKERVSEGVLVNGRQTWLSINEKGEHIERIYIKVCVERSQAIFPDSLKHPSDYDNVNLRFPWGLCYKYEGCGFRARVRGEYLTPHISYNLNLVFHYIYESDVNWFKHLRYKIDGEAKVSIIYSSYMREDGWFIAPLHHFTSQHITADLKFEFENPLTSLLVAGFEYQPSEEKVEPLVFEEYQHILEAASQSLFYTSLDELKDILTIGIHLNGYKTWFSLNEKGEHCELISMEECLIPNEDYNPPFASNYLSRFPAGFYQTDQCRFKTHVKTQLLTPSITYTVNLVCTSFQRGKQVCVDLKYRLRGEATTSVVYLANQGRKEDLLYMAELYQFTSDGSIVDLEIDFDYHLSDLEVEGIMFQPLEKVEDQLLENDRVEDIETISDSDAYWEQKIPNDYEEILKLSKVSLEWKTKKELYSILCKGFLLDNGYEGLSVDKNGKKCQVISARAVAIDDNNSNWESSNESRFGEVLVKTGGHHFQIQGIIEPQDVSPETSYAVYLVFKLPQDQSTFEAPIKVNDANADYVSRYPWFIYLVSPPVTPIIGPKLDENSYNPLNRYKGTAIPQQRSDGWMEVKVWEFTESVFMHLSFSHPGYKSFRKDGGKKNLSGLMIQGIELRSI